MSITRDIYRSLDQGCEVRGVFIDISKTFGKVWHKGLVHKLEQNGINGHLLKILTDFLKSKKQRVFLNGQHSSWGDVLAGVLFISMIYLMVFSVTQNCLQMIPHCLLQCIILTKQQIIWIMTWPKSRNRLSIRKWALIQIFLGRLMNITFFPQKVYNIPYSFNF